MLLREGLAGGGVTGVGVGAITSSTGGRDSNGDTGRGGCGVILRDAAIAGAACGTDGGADGVGALTAAVVTATGAEDASVGA